MVGRAVVPGTGGELVQGRLGGKAFLVTLPVALFSRAEVRLGENDGHAAEGGAVIVREPPKGPANWTSKGPATVLGATLQATGVCTGPDPSGGGGSAQGGSGRATGKARRAVEETLRYLGYPGGSYRLKVESAIPVGKGMASSTADVVAACLAAARALGRELSPRELAALALGVEPSDGLMYPGFALFDHLGGTMAAPLGYLPCRLLLLDLGGEVDTLIFNERGDLGRLEKKRARWSTLALEQVGEGIARGDPAMLGRGTTLSALSHQEILPKPGLEEIWRWGREEGALGINIAHSGTVVGVIFPAVRRVPRLPAGLPGRTLAVVSTVGRGVV